MAMRRQLARYVTVGVLSNLALYAGYLLLTFMGLGHKLAMSLLYAVGVLQTFVLNKLWSFGHKGPSGAPLLRYVLVYALGYLVNLSALVLLVDIAGAPHEAVQGAMIVAIASGMFVLQKYWVFQPSTAASEGRRTQ
jgi:putative flippase GtrA